MTTDFFRGKALAIAGLLSALFLISGFFYARILGGAQVIDLAQNFYFLVSEEEHVAVSAQSIYLSGGAGYIITRGREEYAVLACYQKEADARTVRDNLAIRQISTEILKESSGHLYLKSRSEKENAEKIKGFFSTLYSCTTFLGDVAIKAEKGEYSQRKLKETLQEVNKVLSCLARENKCLSEEFFLYTTKASEKLNEMNRGVVYAKDIRYVQIYLSDCFLSLASRFSL